MTIENAGKLEKNYLQLIHKIVFYFCLKAISSLLALISLSFPNTSIAYHHLKNINNHRTIQITIKLGKATKV